MFSIRLWRFLIQIRLLITNGRTNNHSVIHAIDNTEFWKKLALFYELLKSYDHIIMILKSEQATLGQVIHQEIFLGVKLRKFTKPS